MRLRGASRRMPAQLRRGWLQQPSAAALGLHCGKAQQSTSSIPALCPDRASGSARFRQMATWRALPSSYQSIAFTPKAGPRSTPSPADARTPL